jgi:hypothetical protein
MFSGSARLWLFFLAASPGRRPSFHTLFRRTIVKPGIRFWHVGNRLRGNRAVGLVDRELTDMVLVWAVEIGS